MPSNQQAMDFSDLGARPVQPTPSAASPTSSGSLDFSDLGAKKITAAPTSDSTSDQQPSSVWDKTKKFVSDIPEGVGKGAAETAGTIASGISKVTRLPINPEFTKQQEHTGAESPGEMVGKGAEGLAEFFVGDEALKGLSYAAKLKMATKLAELAESHPVMSKIIQSGLNVVRGSTVQSGLNVVRGGVVSGVQSAAHGQSATEGAAYGAAGSAGAEVLGAGAKYLASKTPAAVEAAAKAKFTADQAEKAVKADALQNVAKPQLANVATSAAQKVLGKLPAGVSSFGDAAEAIKTDAKPIFQTLDKDSGGLFQIAKNQAEIARKIIRNPSSVEAAEKAAASLSDAEAKMEQVFSGSKLAPEDLAKARSSWRAASTLEDLHGHLDKAFSLPQKAVRSIAKATGTEPATVISPGKYKSQLDAAIRNIPTDRLAETIGHDGIVSLYKINDLFSEAMSSDKQQKALMTTIRAALSKGPQLPAGLSSLATGGGAAGLAHAIGLSPGIGFPVAAAHWLYTHPVQGEAVLKYASKAAPVAAQAAKQTVNQAGADVITHFYNPDTEQVEPAQ